MLAKVCRGLCLHACSVNNTIFRTGRGSIPGLLSTSLVPLRLVTIRHNPSRDMEDAIPRVLSIQSHVVSGYVGNKSASFPLQVLGFEVDAINSVQFSNHTGYGYWKGQVLAEQELVDLAEGLAHNQLDCGYTHLLTGYNRSKSFLSHIANIVKQLRGKNPKLIYLCDPVMGDIGRGLYVPSELVQVYKESIVPIANIVTPNQFELELLSDRLVKSVDDVWEATKVLHDMGPHTVVVSSSELCDEKYLLCLGSSVIDGKRQRAMLSFPKLEGQYTGTGDLFSALFLAWMWRSKQNMKQSLECTIATIHAVLRRTEAYKKGISGAAARELKLIQSKSDIEMPKVEYHAVDVTC